MAIEKRFIHFKKFSDFNSKKLSANEANTQYTVGVSGEIQDGSPDVLYQSYVWIKDTRQQWTHGALYDCGDTSEFVTEEYVDNAVEAVNVKGEDGYVYSNGEKVDMRFTRSLIPIGTDIPANADLNTIPYLKIGKYYCNSSSDAQTISNCPVSVAFSMEIFNPLSTNVDDEETNAYNYRLRIIKEFNTGVQYTQFCKTTGTPGVWTYNPWYITPRTSFALNSSKNDGSAAKGTDTKGVYINSDGEFKEMTYTLGKSVPSSAEFTDTKVTDVNNHYTPTENTNSQIDAPEGEAVIGLKRDSAGHVVGVITSSLGKTDIIVTNKSDLDELYKDVPEGTKAVVVNTVSYVLGVNLFDFFIGNVEGVEEILSQPEAYTLKISSVDTNIELPISDTGDVRVEIPFNDKISIDMGADLASIYAIYVQKGFAESIWSNGHWWDSAQYLIDNEMPLSALLLSDDNVFAGLMAIAPALIVDFVGTKTITEYIKNSDNWEVWSKGKLGLNELRYSISQDIPTKTSQLENNSNFVKAADIKTINGESILGSGNIAIDANIQAVDTHETLDDVETNTYVKYVAQTLTEVQKAQVRENIGIVDNNNYIAWDSVAFEMGNAYYMAPNKKYICIVPLTYLIFREGLADDTWHNNVTDLYNEYTVIFECNDTQIETPNSWIWANGSVPTLENGVRYELSISLMYINNQYLTHAVLVPFKSV